MVVKQNRVATKSVLARQDNGTIQLTLSIAYSDVQKEREIVLRHLVEDLEVPGFRKGKAPTDVAVKHIDRQRIYEHTLQHLLPRAYSEAVGEHKLRPILSPRFELIAVEEGKDWQVRAVTCELPDINLGDYKKLVKDNAKTSAIWTPEKGDTKTEPTHEEREQQVIKTLLENVEVRLPVLLVEDEVNHKLSQLLNQVQRLGLTVDQYLSSIGKTLDQVKEEYAKQAEDSIKLVLILNKVGEEEKVQVSDLEVDGVVKASVNAANGDTKAKEAAESFEQKHLIYAILMRRKALDSLTSLI